MDNRGRIRMGLESGMQSFSNFLLKIIIFLTIKKKIKPKLKMYL